MALKDLFKRQPGGTALGNAIRVTLNTATKGVLGNGALMISPAAAAARDAGNTAPAKVELKEQIATVAGNAAGGIKQADLAGQMEKGAIAAFKPAAYIGGALAIGAVIWKAVTGNSNSQTSSKRKK